MDEFEWDWNINDLEEMGNREAWEDAQAFHQEMEDLDDSEVEDGDWEDENDNLATDWDSMDWDND
jgi:hypothetical protein